MERRLEEMGSWPGNDFSRLMSDVRIAGVGSSTDRIRIYDGTRGAIDESYTLPAFVPRLPPRPATSSELLQLLADPVEPFIAAQHVGIVKGFEEIRKAFLPLLHCIESAPAHKPAGEDAALIEQINDNALAAVTPLLDLNASKPFIHKVGIVAREPGLLTTTFNHSAGKYIGLHLDSFFRRDLTERPASPNRICINVGSESRYLIFMNLTLRKCYELLAEAGFQEDSMEDPNIGLPELFMRSFPEYPIIQLRIDPGEAYIAPTENLIHDSTTLGQQSLDVSLIFLGTFRMPSDKRHPEGAGEVSKPANGGSFDTSQGQDAATEQRNQQKERHQRFYNEANRRLNSSPDLSQTYFLNYGYVATDESPLNAMAQQHAEPDSARLALEVIGDCELRGKNVLDVGCGRGGTIHLIQRFFSPRSITGVDYSPAAIAFCRERHGGAATTFQQADAECLPFANETFDAVTNIESSHCYPDVEAFYREVYRVLVPGGYFLYTDLFQGEKKNNHIRTLSRLGFIVEGNRDITENVLLACNREAPYADPAFAGSENMGSQMALIYIRTIKELREGLSVYKILKLKKLQ